MIPFADSLEYQSHSQNKCLTLAALFHIGLLFWNPVIFHQTWKILTAQGEGVVVIWDSPGPESTLIPGPRLQEKPSLPRFKSNVSLPLTSDRIVAPNTSLVSKPFRISPVAPLPTRADLGISNDPAAMRIPVIKEATPNLPLHNPAPLKERTGRSPFSGSSTGSGLLSGEGGTGGRVIIRFTEPVPTQVAHEAVQPRLPARADKDSILEGPLSNRGIVRRVIPSYPTWAEEQGIMGTVRLHFTVTSAGAVRPTIRVERTSGNSELDRLATDALRQWRFAPAAADDGHNWGIITFTFSL